MFERQIDSPRALQCHTHPRRRCPQRFLVTYLIHVKRNAQLVFFLLLCNVNQASSRVNLHPCIYQCPVAVLALDHRNHFGKGQVLFFESPDLDTAIIFRISYQLFSFTGVEGGGVVHAKRPNAASVNASANFF